MTGSALSPLYTTVGSGSEDMLLDPAIRNWVLFPIMGIMILVGLLRHYVTLLLNTTKGPKAPPSDARPLGDAAKGIRESQVLTRSSQLRLNARHIPYAAFLQRKNYLINAFNNHQYLKAPPSSNPADADESKPPTQPDPMMMTQMMEGMKRNMALIVPQSLIMGWINFWFSGFVLIKLPFALTSQFKAMLQRGIDAPNMEVAWVSSLSWYFLNLFGLSSVFRLILGESHAADSAKDMEAMASGGLGTRQPQAGASMLPGQAPNMIKIFQSERENLELLSITAESYVGMGIERRLLEQYKRIGVTTPA